MRWLGRSAAVLALVALPALVIPPGPPAAAAGPRTWYVDADAARGGDGSSGRPFGTLIAVERASAPGDTIVVRPSDRALDGGIRLQPGQTLSGSAPAVRSLAETASAPTLTNTGTRLGGDAVRLADGVAVRNLRIRHTARGGIYGLDVTGVRIVGNDVAGHNTSCTRGFLIPQFNAPTNVPGVGIPIVGGLPNGWAGIMVDGSRRTGATALVADNVVHDAECGDGIDVRTWGTASYRVTVLRNDVHHLRQGDALKSVLAIGTQAADRSSLLARIVGNTQSALGNPDEVNLGPEGADSEGVFVNGVGPSSIQVVVEDNTYTNEDGVGGFSANGLEAVTMGDGSFLSVIVRDSSFSGSPGDVIEEGALGTDAVLRMRLENVVAERSTGVGNTYLLPFNNGDCVLAGSLGAGNDVGLVVRNSAFRDCASNGLAIGSNVVNGSGPTKAISLDVDASTITGNAGSNLGIRNFTGLGSLSVRVRRTDLAGSAGLGASVADVAAEDLGTTDSASIDLSDDTCIGALLGIDTVQYDVVARGVWWGSAGGPGPLTTAALGGTVDASSPLVARPEWCS